MVKNIIFDIGNVLATFQPKVFLRELFQDEAIVEQLYKTFFTKWWHLYDQGIYSIQDLIDMGSLQLPMYTKEIVHMMSVWPQYVRPIQSSMNAIQELQKQGYDTYILSNIPKESYVYLKEHYDFIDWMKGGIYSYQDRVIKPDEKIYRLLLDRYGLKADECLFIDDKKENIESAEKLGFQGIVLKDPKDLMWCIKERLNEV